MSQSSPESVVLAIRRLGCDQRSERVRARESLEAVGTSATWHLIQAVYLSDERTRHEALKILVGLRDPAAADLFVELLDDEDSDCRWFAAVGLAALGEAGLRRTLELLVLVPKTAPMLQSLHHVLSELRKSGFSAIAAPVLEAFQGGARETRLLTAAHEALNQLRGARQTRSQDDTRTTR